MCLTPSGVFPAGRRLSETATSEAPVPSPDPPVAGVDESEWSYVDEEDDEVEDEVGSDAAESAAPDEVRDMRE